MLLIPGITGSANQGICIPNSRDAWFPAHSSWDSDGPPGNKGPHAQCSAGPQRQVAGSWACPRGAPEGKGQPHSHCVPCSQ